MATVFPKKRLQDEEVLSIDDINGAFGAMVQEAGSALGEHNWKEGAFSSADMDPTLAVELHRAKQASNRSHWTNPTPSTSFTNGGNTAWSEVDDMSITVQSGNSTFWIMFSGQLTSYSTIPFLTFGSPRHLAIAVNSVPVPETITGSVDRSIDETDMGVTNKRTPVVIDAVLSLPPGEHRISVMCRKVPRTIFVKPSDIGYGTLAVYQSIDSRELIVLEMK
jgi:hypothetical protein|tara:strand:+ start:4235 stop:4897 length:663 start_codon:yes stop_codon:yes gene_type:complete